jgi:flagellar biosynthesis/type III secretory pathway protein FliH
MSTKNRAIGDTENEFQAALATYTKAGNKTATMRRLWNAAYEIRKRAAEAVLVGEEVRAEAAVKGKKSKQIEEAKKVGFAEGRQAGFEEGRDSALTMDTFEVSFRSGKIAGHASGMEIGQEAEEK